jgi:hypothetical protein
MLFEKDIEPCCGYCKRGAPLGDDRVMCEKKGIVLASGACRRFRYDPLKRQPPRPAAADFSNLRDEDFVL